MLILRQSRLIENVRGKRSEKRKKEEEKDGKSGVREVIRNQSFSLSILLASELPPSEIRSAKEVSDSRCKCAVRLKVTDA